MSDISKKPGSNRQKSSLTSLENILNFMESNSLLTIKKLFKNNCEIWGGSLLNKIHLRQRSIAGYVAAPRMDFNKREPDIK